MGSIDETAISGDAPLQIDGRVELDGVFPVEELLGLATGVDRGRPSIALVDVLAGIRLSTRADVVVLRRTGHRGSVALPVRAIVRQPNIRLLVDTSTSPVRSVLLDAPGWSDERPVVSRITALTFEEFVMMR